MTITNNNDELSRNLLELTIEERALIMGTLLGDAHLQKRGGSYRLKVTHGIKQKEYVKWKHSKLIRFCTTTQGPAVKVDNKGFETVTFYTSSGMWLKDIHELFYKSVNGRSVKTITQELINNLPMHPMVLASFFMDDGSVRNDCYAGKLATQGFTKEESKLFCQYLNKWGIQGNVVAHSVSKNQYYIGLPVSTFGKLVQTIESIVKEIPTMEYKLNGPNKTP